MLVLFAVAAIAGFVGFIIGGEAAYRNVWRSADVVIDSLRRELREWQAAYDLVKAETESEAARRQECHELERLYENSTD